MAPKIGRTKGYHMPYIYERNSNHMNKQGGYDPSNEFIRKHYRQIKSYIPSLATKFFEPKNQDLTPNQIGASMYEGQRLERNTIDFHIPPHVMQIIPKNLRPPNDGAYDSEATAAAVQEQPKLPVKVPEKIKYPDEVKILPITREQEETHKKRKHAYIEEANIYETKEQEESPAKRQKPWYSKAALSILSWFKSAGIKLLKWIGKMILENYRYIAPLVDFIFFFFDIVFPGSGTLVKFLYVITSTLGVLASKVLWFTYETIKWNDGENFWSYAARIIGGIFINLACAIPNVILQVCQLSRFYLMGTLETIQQWNTLLGTIAIDIALTLMKVFGVWGKLLKPLWNCLLWVFKTLGTFMVKLILNASMRVDMVSFLMVISYVAEQMGISQEKQKIVGETIVQKIKKIYDFIRPKVEASLGAADQGEFDEDIFYDAIESFDQNIVEEEVFHDAVEHLPQIGSVKIPDNPNVSPNWWGGKIPSSIGPTVPETNFNPINNLQNNAANAYLGSGITGMAVPQISS